ncbi:MAG: hypothetical protein Q8P67_28470 [archaeon]|nr:hypothetical protein [archaeon]
MSNKLAESGEGSDPLRDALKVVYSAVENVPEPIVPVGDEQHAMTGHVVLRSFYKLLVTLQNDLHPSFRPSGSSVFLDVGSGMGRPVLSFACLPIKASIGIELQGLPTAMSCVVLRQLYVSFFHFFFSSSLISFSNLQPILIFVLRPFFLSFGDTIYLKNKKC